MLHFKNGFPEPNITVNIDQQMGLQRLEMLLPILTAKADSFKLR